MTPTLFGRYRKAFYALFGYVTTATVALSSLAFLSGPISHNLAVASAVAGGAVTFLSTALGPKNTDPTPAVVQSRAWELAREVRQVLADAELIRAALTPPVSATSAYGPSPTDLSTVIGGTVEMARR